MKTRREEPDEGRCAHLWRPRRGLIKDRRPIVKPNILSTDERRGPRLPAADIAALPECPFCLRERPEFAFCGDERFLALYNIAPILPGHSLVAPRAHVASLLELPEDDLGAFVLFARRVTRVLARAFAADGFDWSI